MDTQHLLRQWGFGGQNRDPPSFPREWLLGKGSADLPLALSSAPGTGTRGHRGLGGLARALGVQMTELGTGLGSALLCSALRGKIHRELSSGSESAGQGQGRRCPCSTCPLCPQHCPPRSPWHGPLFSAWFWGFFGFKSLLMTGPAGAARFTMGTEPPGCESRNVPAFDGLVGRSWRLQRALLCGSFESRKGWQGCPGFAAAFVHLRDHLLITTFRFICKTCLEDNLIISYKRSLYLPSLSLCLGCH